jgi:hypothetical protein
MSFPSARTNPIVAGLKKSLGRFVLLGWRRRPRDHELHLVPPWELAIKSANRIMLEMSSFELSCSGDCAASAQNEEIRESIAANIVPLSSSQLSK